MVFALALYHRAGRHAGDWEKGLHDKVKASLAPLIDERYRNRRSAAVGYIHGLPPAG